MSFDLTWAVAEKRNLLLTTTMGDHLFEPDYIERIEKSEGADSFSNNIWAKLPTELVTGTVHPWDGEGEGEGEGGKKREREGGKERERKERKSKELNRHH